METPRQADGKRKGQGQPAKLMLNRKKHTTSNKGTGRKCPVAAIEEALSETGGYQGPCLLWKCEIVFNLLVCLFSPTTHHN